MKTFTSVLGLEEDAWDVYMIYGPSARWEGDAPPRPEYWMHQLGTKGLSRVKGPYLDPDEFARQAIRLGGSPPLPGPKTSTVSGAIPHAP